MALLLRSVAVSKWIIHKFAFKFVSCSGDQHFYFYFYFLSIYVQSAGISNVDQRSIMDPSSQNYLRGQAELYSDPISVDVG